MEVSRLDCSMLMHAERTTHVPVDEMAGDGLVRVGFNEDYEADRVEMRLLHWKGVVEHEMRVRFPAEALDTLAGMWFVHRVLELPNDDRALVGLSVEMLKWLQKLAELATAKLAYWADESVAEADEQTEVLESMHAIVGRVALAWQAQAQAQADREWSRRDGRSRIVE